MLNLNTPEIQAKREQFKQSHQEKLTARMTAIKPAKLSKEQKLALKQPK